jgi:hypothetical protein
MEAIDFPPMSKSTEEFEALIKSEIELVAKLMKTIKLPAKEL